MPRQFKRYPISLEIVLDFLSGKREARISDLSMSGCFVDSIINVREGEPVAFNLNMPTGEWLHLSGEVIYHLPNIGFGILFTNLSEEKQRLLEQIIVAYGGEPQAPGD
jgi:hypothetical protein